MVVADTSLVAHVTLSYVYGLQGRYQSALAISRTAYERASKTLSPTHEILLSSKFELAETLRMLSKYRESERLFREVIETRGSMLGPEDDRKDILNSMSGLAGCLEVQGKHEECEKIMRQVITARSLENGADHPDVLGDIHSFCVSLFRQGKYAECEEENKKVLKKSIRLLGRERRYSFNIRFHNYPVQFDEGTSILSNISTLSCHVFVLRS
jgi:tetratricopeptide (TPR) repeat protein